ncbi:hypothetical protein Dimus_031779 [Dionaea muscipula]
MHLHAISFESAAWPFKVCYLTICRRPLKKSSSRSPESSPTPPASDRMGSSAAAADESSIAANHRRSRGSRRRRLPSLVLAGAQLAPSSPLPSLVLVVVLRLMHIC